MILKTTEELRVCRGINDPTMIDIAERKEQTSLFQIDSQRSIVDGKIVKCIRSTKCSYILNESKVRCNECQVFVRSNMRKKTYTKWLPKPKERQNDTTFFCIKKKNKKKLKLPKISTPDPLTFKN